LPTAEAFISPVAAGEYKSNRIILTVGSDERLKLLYAVFLRMAVINMEQNLTDRQFNPFRMLGATRFDFRFEMEYTLTQRLIEVVANVPIHFTKRSLWILHNQHHLQDAAYGVYDNILENQQLNLAQDELIVKIVMTGNRAKYFSWDRDHLFRGSISRVALNIVSNLTFARSDEEEDQSERSRQLGPIALWLLDVEKALSEKVEELTKVRTAHLFPEPFIELRVPIPPESDHGYGNENGDGLQSIWEADQWVSHLTRGLAKAHSSAVDGDGATSSTMWTPWTPALSAQITLDLSVHLLAADPTKVAYGVTPDRIERTVLNGELPLYITTTSPWNQQTPEKKEMLLLLGCQCPTCAVLLPGDVNDNAEPVAVCAQCGERVTMVRTWIAK
jgi:hypothetical protein